MDFELTQEQKDIQKAAREFAENELDKDYSLEIERSRWGLISRKNTVGKDMSF
jgi:hypothetical protein